VGSVQRGYAPPPPAAPKRKRGGCCLVWLLIPIALIALAWAVWHFFPDLIPIRSDNLQMGKGVKVAQTTVPASGGTVTVDDPGGALDGLTITVPEGAYEGKSKFTVTEVPIESYDLGPYFQPAGPLIRIDNGHKFADEPMTVEIPMEIGPDEFAMAFYYDSRTGELEGIPTVGMTSDKLTVIASHFSDIVPAKFDVAELQSADINSGFMPGVDDWQFTNYGSIIAPGGHCAGQSITAMWYYYEQRLAKGEPALYGLFDNNNYPYRTTDLWQDDSWGYRFASVAQHDLLWDSRAQRVYSALGDWGGDAYTYYAFAASMMVTGEPQFVYIWGTYIDKDGHQQSGAHAIVAYKVAPEGIYVADPNYPGKSGRLIRFENNKLLPYSSGANAAAIAAQGEVSYTYVRYMAKTALIDWDKLGGDYRDMLKGESGDGVFPAYKIERLVSVDPDTGEEVWAECDDVIELDEAATALAGEDRRGKLAFRITMDDAVAPAGFETYIYVRDKYALDMGLTRRMARGVLNLKPGVTELGFYTLIKKGTGLEYNDFRRIKIIYEKPDLSGEWVGTLQIQEVFNLTRYIEDWLGKIVMALGFTDDEAQVREAVRSSIEEDENLHSERELRIQLEAIPDKPDHYKMVGWFQGDLESPTYEGEAVYDKGEIRFIFNASDGSSFEFRGDVRDDGMEGEFSISAWRIVKNAGSGIWHATRQAP
jgi:hypothetical protein